MAQKIRGGEARKSQVKLLVEPGCEIHGIGPSREWVMEGKRSATTSKCSVEILSMGVPCWVVAMPGPLPYWTCS